MLKQMKIGTKKIINTFERKPYQQYFQTKNDMKYFMSFVKNNIYCIMIDDIIYYYILKME